MQNYRTDLRGALFNCICILEIKKTPININVGGNFQSANKLCIISVWA